MSLDQLSRDDRLTLMRFVCSFAWADLKVREEERLFVAGLMQKLDLSDDDAQLVSGWMIHPPAPEEVDPMEIPTQHREIFLAAVREMVKADGEIAKHEADTYLLLEQLLS
jgi:uncharacterized tellurite resistance protein B-like protein